MNIPCAPVLWMASLGAMTWFSTVPLRAETVSLQPVMDTTLIENAPGNNLGGADFFNAGTAGNGQRNRALMFFDLSGTIPAGSIITGAELTMDIIRQPNSNGRNSFFGLRRMFQNWGEGTQVPAEPESPGQGGPAADGEATWDFRFATVTPWSTAGGQEGVDFSSEASSMAFVSTLGQTVLFESSSGLLADLQSWLDHPEANFGWMLKSESEEIAKTARSFASRESGFGPTLTVSFIPVPEPGTLSLACVFLICAGLMMRRRR